MCNVDLFTATPWHRAVYHFDEVMRTAGSWLFPVGALFFAARPTVRLLRAFHLSRLPVPGDPDPRAGG